MQNGFTPETNRHHAPSWAQPDGVAAAGTVRGYLIELADALQAESEISMSRISNSTRIHPELATPDLLAFWLAEFQDVCARLAEVQAARSAKIRELADGY